MAMKPNPGCQMPELKVPVDLSQLTAANKAAKEAYQAAQKGVGQVIAAIGLVPGGDLLGAVAAREFWKIQEVAENTAAAQEITNAVQEAQGLADRSAALLSSLGNISCPLPDVLDKDANPTT